MIKLLSLIDRFIEIYNKRKIDWTTSDELFMTVVEAVALVVILFIIGVIAYFIIRWRDK